MTAQPAAAHREHGFALLIVLWTLVLISLLLTRVTSAGSGEARLASNLRTGIALQQIADGAVYDAIFHVLDNTSAQRWSVDGRSRSILVQRLPVSVTVNSLGGRINPNIAPADLLSALIRVLGEEPRVADQIASSIIDWRSPGQRSRVTGGSKLDAYKSAGRTLAPLGAKFQTIDDLGLVIGITPRLLALMRPHLTLYTTTDPVRALADPIVAHAMDLLAGGTTGEGPDQQTETVIAIQTKARLPNGAEAQRVAVASISASGNGLPWHVLAWDDHAH